jgi:hypothetical protein
VIARVPGRARPPFPAPTGRPGAAAPASTPGRIPPNVLARINQAWGKQAPAPTRRPANWPAPPPPAPPPLQAPLARQFRDLLIGLGLVAFFGLIRLVGWVSVHLQEQSADEGEVATQPAPVVVTAPPAPVAPREPDWVERDQLREQLAVLSSALLENNAYALQRGLSRMRGEARGRQASWRLTRERAAATGVPAATIAGPEALPAAALEQQRQGWAALEQGNAVEASGHFATALWFDPDAADAWFGYGLASRDGVAASGNIAMAILLYPDPATARASRAAFEARLAHAPAPDGEGAARKRREALDLVMLQASVAAERIRPQLEPGTVRMAESFAWGRR